MIRRTILILVLLGLFMGGIVAWQIMTPAQKRIGVLRDVVGATQQQLEQWVGSQLERIANEYLKPELRFESMRYHPPGTVSLHDVTLSAEGESVLTLETMTVTLAEVPKLGHPIVIKTLTLDSPTLLFREIEGALLVWGDMVEPGSGEVKADGGSTKLSDVFAIDHIAIDNASISYEQPGHPRMALDGMSFDLTRNAHRDESGWHRITTRLDREHLFDADIDGRLNLDTFTLDLESLMARAAIHAESYQFFPPQLQSWLAMHEVRGELELGMDGEIVLTDMLSSTLTAHTSLLNGYARAGEYTMPIQMLDISAAMSGGTLAIDECMLAALGGTASATASIGLDQAGMFELELDTMGLRLEDFLSTKIGATTNPKFAGRLDMQATLAGQTRDARRTATGRGKLSATHGRFGDLPVIGDIVRVVAGLHRIGPKYNDRLTTDFSIESEQLRLRNIDMRSTAIAARGSGEIGLDQSLNLRLNAGPLEAVQNALGEIGRIIGRITDQLLTYQVRGTLSNPTVQVKPLGF